MTLSKNDVAAFEEGIRSLEELSGLTEVTIPMTEPSSARIYGGRAKERGYDVKIGARLIEIAPPKNDYYIIISKK